MARSRSRISHKKELYYILCIIALILILGFSFFGPGGYRELRKARLELQEQRSRVEALKRDNNERRKSIEALRSDEEALEKYAGKKAMGERERSSSNCARTGEKIKITWA